MRRVILETRDGWWKRMLIPANQPTVRVSFMSARDFALDREGEFDTARTASYRYMDFEWDGRTTENEVDRWGNHHRVEVWRER